MDVALFFGRFHPLVVHLPIGFLLLACVLFCLSLFKQFNFLVKTLPIVLLLGTMSAGVAVILGLLLATEGGYDETTLGWHQWMGIAVAMLSFLGWCWIKGVSIATFKLRKSLLNQDEVQQRISANRKHVVIIMSALFVLISITGHLGGNLTHGSDYLVAHAPAFVKTILNDETNGADPFPMDSDSILLYDHLIQPVLQKKCASCHNENKIKGGLLLTSREGLLKGGENGSVVEPGSAIGSELVKRICLDPTNKKYMPLKGIAMSYPEIALLSFWIDNGMSFEIAITDESVPPNIKSLIEQRYGLSTARKSFVEKQTVAPADKGTIESLSANGYKIRHLAEDNFFLEVIAKDSLTREQVEALLEIKEQITWLDLSKSNLQDDWMHVFPSFINLTKLMLNNNPITDQGIEQLESLEHLEVVNLHHTNISNTGLNSLLSIESLKQLYLWETKVTQQAVDSIQRQGSVVKIDIGVLSEEK